MTTPSVAFAKATKTQAYLRLALEGPAGYGKTYTALVVATGLAGEKRVAFLDTEFGSASKYADLFDFDTIQMDPPFHPDRAVEAIRAAADAGYGAVVLDSLSHFWMGDGGLLDLLDQIARTRYRNDTHRAWKDAGEIQQRLTDAILRAPLHVVAAMRTKKDYVRETVTEDGKERTKIRAAGTKTVQRDEFDYEFDVIGRFDTPAVMAIIKSRYAGLPPETIIEKPGKPFVDQLADFLGTGEPLADAKQHKKLDKLISDLTKADGSKNWTNVLAAYTLRDFSRSRDQLTVSQMEQTLATLGEHLATINANSNGSEPEPAEAEQQELATA